MGCLQRSELEAFRRPDNHDGHLFKFVRRVQRPAHQSTRDAVFAALPVLENHHFNQPPPGSLSFPAVLLRSTVFRVTMYSRGTRAGETVPESDGYARPFNERSGLPASVELC